jgi:hypothetical protein
MTTVDVDLQTSSHSQRWIRIAGIAGIAYAVIFLAMGVGIASGAPVFTDGADELRTWFGDNQGAIGLFTWLGPVTAGPLFLLFAAGLRRRLEGDDPSGGMLMQISYSGAVAGFAFSLVALGFWGVMTLDPVLESASDGLLVTLSALDSVVFFVVAPWAFSLFIVAASVVMLLSRAMPVWLGAAGCLLGVLNVLGGLWIFDGDPSGGVSVLGFVGFFGGLLWTVVTSVFMIRDRPAA